MSKLTYAATLGAIVAGLVATSFAFTSAVRTTPSGRSTRLAVDPTEMMQRAPYDLPMEWPQAY